MENSPNKDNNNYTINKLPYLCTTQNLFDLFLIIGYDDDLSQKEIQKEVEELAKSNEDSNNRNEASYFSVHQNQLQAAIISSVCSRENPVMLECELITKLVFPAPPPMYYILDNPNSKKKKYDPNQYSVVFFMNSDTMEANSKIPFHGYSYIFYEKKEERIEFKQSDSSVVSKNLRTYVPKAFTFISQFPYFSQYFLLAKSIHELYQSDKEIEIPIEILLFNIINFTPAPINNNMNISFLPVNDLVTIKKNWESQSKNSTPGNENIIQAVNNPVETKEIESIGNFPGLSGYPLFDFNLSEIFNILPLENIVEILIFNFLEVDTLFFSKNIEVLNIVMYIISALNYPCNDTIYLWHVVSVSKKELEDSSASSKFIGKPFTTMVGVNDQYDEKKIDTSQFTKAMFIADLDKKEFSYKYSQTGDERDQEDINKLIKLYSFIDKIINDKGVLNTKTQSSLEINVRKLVSELEVKCKKVIHSNYSYCNQIIPHFLIGNVNYQSNKAIQEIFYDFILNILKTLYTNYKLTSSIDTTTLKNTSSHKYDCSLDFNDSNLIEEEKIFYELFQGCTKAGSYIKNFLSLHTCMELYHIPLVFSEEFIQLKNQTFLENYKTKHFEIMDNFYIKSTKPIEFNFKEFYVFYNDELKDKVYNETLESKLITSTKKKLLNTNKSKYTYQYRKKELDKEVLFRYIYYLNGLSTDKLERIFPFMNQINHNSIKLVRYSEISQEVELSYVQNKVYTINDLISLSIITFYSLTVFYQTEEQFKMQFQIIFELLLRQKYCVRRYIIMSISLYYRHAIYLKSKGLNYTYLLIGYHRLMELLEYWESVPNEELVKLIEDFEKIDDQWIKYSKYLNKEEELLSCEFMKRKNGKNGKNRKKDSNGDLTLKKTPSGPQDNNNDKSLFIPTTKETSKDSLMSKPTGARQSITKLKTSLPVNLKKSSVDFKNEEIINSELIKANGQKSYLFKIKNNFCRDGFFKEDYILRRAAISYFEGGLLMTCTKCDREISPRILFHHKLTEKEFEYELLTPLTIYKQINNQLNSYLSDMRLEDLNCEMLNKIMINLLFYQMNILSLQIKTEMVILFLYQSK